MPWLFVISRLPFFFFGIRLRPEARLTPFYDHTALKRAVNGLIS